MLWRRALLSALCGLLLAAAPAAAQAPGVPPPGANDFSCRSSAPPVILVHGTFGDMTVSWNLFAPALEARGYCVYALDLVNRGMAPMDKSADKLAAFIDEVRAKTGAAKVSIVGHSQGGMLPRYVAKFRGELGAIADLVGLAPSSHGTKNPLAPPLGGLGCPACAEQAAGSAFMKKLNAAPEAPGPIDYTVVSTTHDEVVTPYRSQALSGSSVTNVVLQRTCPEDITDHVGIIYDPIALQWTLNALGRPGPADPSFQPKCGGSVTSAAPAMFPGARKPAVHGRRAVVRLVCTGVVGRCAGRLVMRDRHGKLNRGKALDIAVGHRKAVKLRLRRRPADRVTVKVLTLQPGGWVTATHHYVLRR
jgi:triacylglycerol lipase